VTLLENEANMHATKREQRRIQRSRVFFGGEVLIGRDFRPRECHIMNISRCGAYVDVLNDSLLPAEFDLFIRKTNERHRAVVAWRLGRRMGVAFRQSAH
jgi:hypothetical protein